MENDNGRLLISKDTLENLVINIVRGFDGTENVVAKVGLDKENNLKVYITLYILISELHIIVFMIISFCIN